MERLQGQVRSKKREAFSGGCDLGCSEVGSFRRRPF